MCQGDPNVFAAKLDPKVNFSGLRYVGVGAFQDQADARPDQALLRCPNMALIEYAPNNSYFEPNVDTDGPRT